MMRLPGMPMLPGAQFYDVSWCTPNLPLLVLLSLLPTAWQAPPSASADPDALPGHPDALRPPGAGAGGAQWHCGRSQVSACARPDQQPMGPQGRHQAATLAGL